MWHLQDDSINDLCISWRRACRKAIGLPDRTHNILLPLICNSVPLILTLYKRFIKFYLSCLNSPNDIVRFITNNAMNTGCTVTSYNLHHIMYKFGITEYQLQNNSYAYTAKVISDWFLKNVDNDSKSYTLIIKECVNVRDNISLSPLSRNECKIIIDQLCLM